MNPPPAVLAHEADQVTVHSYLEADAPRTLADDVLDGLTRPFKELAPKHLYDDRGSDLFDQICDLPEYYPTRAERSILETRAADIVARTRAVELVELGSGTAEKTKVLLAQGFERYIPFDVSASTLVQSAAALVKHFPDLEVHGIVGDFERHLSQIPRSVAGEPRLVAFLGGTIGNFTPGARRSFLRSIAATLGPQDFLLLGTDLVKDIDILEAAYDDAAGVTAEFNLNMLRVLNRELDADFDPDLFEHVAFFDIEHEWIEMRLRSVREQTVNVRSLDLAVHFDRGEEMRTEISAKFTRERLEADYEAAGLILDTWLTDPDGLYALTLARPA